MQSNDDIYVDKSELLLFTNQKINKNKRCFCVSRPRRFGKSLFLNMLGIYYDINKQDKFEEIFGGLYIGKHPTPKISVRTTISYAILSTLTRLLEKMQVSFKR